MCHFVLFTSQILGFQLVKARLLDLRKLVFPLFILGIFYARIGACGIQETRFCFRHTPGGECNRTLSPAPFIRARAGMCPGIKITTNYDNSYPFIRTRAGMSGFVRLE